MEHKQNPTTGKLRKAINYQQMKIQQQISWVGQSTRYFLKGGEKFQPLGSKTLLTRQKGETVCTKEGESSCAATYALSCEFRSNTFEPFEQQIFCGATFYEGLLLLQMFNRLFFIFIPWSTSGAFVRVRRTYYGEHIMNILWWMSKFVQRKNQILGISYIDSRPLLSTKNNNECKQKGI